MAITVNNFTQKYTNPTAGTRQTSYRLYLEIKENSYDVATNSSNVSYTAWIIGTSTYTTFYGSKMNGVIKQGDTVLAEGSATATKSKPVSSANKYILASGSDDFKHNDDGTLSITLTFTYSSSAGHASAGETEATLKLTNIPRAHGILATDAFIETPPTITVTGKIADFTTTIEYEFGDLKGKIAEKTNNVNITDWVIPDTFYAQIPNDPFDYCKLTATTYNGNNPIGSNTYEFKVTADPDRCRPTAIITAVDTNETTKNLTDGTGNVVVIGKSNVLCTIEKSIVEGKGAEITSVKVNGVELNDLTQVLFNNANTNEFEVIVEDARGYTNKNNDKKVTLEKIDYIDVSIDAKVERNTPTDGKVNITFSGNYFNDTFGNVANTLDVQYKYKEKGASEYSTPQSLALTLTGNTFKGEVKEIGDFDYQKAYIFQVIATDKLTSAPKTPVEIVVNKGEPMWWWDEDAFRVLTEFLVKDRNILNEIDDTNNEIAKTENWIFLRCSAGINATETKEHQIMFDTIQSVNGDLLTLENGCLKIGSGVKAIEVVAQLYFYSGTAARKAIRIYKNTTDANRKFVTYANYHMYDVTCFMNTTEGDLIKFTAELTSGDVINIANTIMMARVIA